MTMPLRLSNVALRDVVVDFGRRASFCIRCRSASARAPPTAVSPTCRYVTDNNIAPPRSNTRSHTEICRFQSPPCAIGGELRTLHGRSARCPIKCPIARRELTPGKPYGCRALSFQSTSESRNEGAPAQREKLSDSAHHGQLFCRVELNRVESSSLLPVFFSRLRRVGTYIEFLLSSDHRQTVNRRNFHRSRTATAALAGVQRPQRPRGHLSTATRLVRREDGASETCLRRWSTSFYPPLENKRAAMYPYESGEESNCRRPLQHSTVAGIFYHSTAD
jgi:hypothetical protein